jgi:hypothetical protein
MAPPIRVIATPEQVRASVWARIEKQPGENGCWLWTGPTFKSGGYGAIKVGGRKGKVLRVHRLVWEWERGPIPDGLKVCHHCDTPACVRPEHLFLGTDADNVRDKMAKGRYVFPSRESAPKGEDHHWCQLTEEQVIEIRERYATGYETCASLAYAYDVSFTNIHAIVTRRSWKHVP